MLLGIGCWAPADQNLRSGVRGWRRDCSSCEWTSNTLQSKASSCLLGWRGEMWGPSLTLSPSLWLTGEVLSMCWEFIGPTTAAREAQWEMGPARKSQGWEKTLYSSCYPTRTLGKWPIIFALNFSIRSTLLEFLLNDTNHPRDPGQL